MTDDDRLPDPSALIASLPPGSAVIVRSREAGAAAERARALLEDARARDVLIVLSAPRPPRTLHADGLHIPGAALGHWRAHDIARLGPALLTMSAHTRRDVNRAADFGADAVLLSPVFATRSHSGAAPLGVMRFAAIAAGAGVPVVALGGITENRVRRVLSAGAAGIAAIGLFHPPVAQP